MTDISTIDKRHVIPQDLIRDIVEQIVCKFEVEKVILFGSYARGEARRESDVDLLIVMQHEQKPCNMAVEILHTIDFHFGLDLIVKTPQELSCRLELGDYFLQDALEEGIILYESNRSRVDSES